MNPPRRKLLLGIGLGVLVAAAAGAPILLSHSSERSFGVTPSRLDFGRVPHGESTHRRLTLRNEGNRDVTIRSVLANCSCFEVDQGFLRFLHPGESTEIAVRFHTMEPTKGELLPAGPLRGKKLNVVSDAPGAGNLEVPLLGDVVELVRIAPPFVELGHVKRDAEIVATSKVRPGAEFRMKVLRWEASHPEWIAVSSIDVEGGVDFTVTSKAGQPGRSLVGATITLELELVPKDGSSTPRRATRTIPIKGDWEL
jgi:hypothetical protein